MAETPRMYGTQVNLPADLASGDLALVSTFVKTVTFKNAAAVASKSFAKKMFIQLVDTSPGATERIVHIAVDAVATVSHYRMAANDKLLTIEYPCNTITFYLETAGNSVSVFIWAFSDVDMTGVISA